MSQPITTDWRSKQPDAGAFTLVELLVVIAIVAMLLCLLPPVHARAKEKDKRIACLVNLKQMGLASLLYAGDSNDWLLPADSLSPGGSSFPMQFNFAGYQVWQQRGLISGQTNGQSIWTCPNRPGYPVLSFNQFVIGYQYYGGITTWRNNLGTFTSASPRRTTTSKPGWMLAADVVASADNGATWDSLSNLPAHKSAAARVPSGGNEVFIDGSARWISGKDMMFIHTSGSSLALYFYQDDLGVLEPQRANLRRIP